MHDRLSVYPRGGGPPGGLPGNRVFFETINKSIDQCLTIYFSMSHKQTMLLTMDGGEEGAAPPSTPSKGIPNLDPYGRRVPHKGTSVAYTICLLELQTHKITAEISLCGYEIKLKSYPVGRMSSSYPVGRRTTSVHTPRDGKSSASRRPHLRDKFHHTKLPHIPSP